MTNSNPLPEFEPVLLFHEKFEPGLRNPKFTPAGGYRLNPEWVVKRVNYEKTLGHAPPYLIYLDHDNQEIFNAVSEILRRLCEGNGRGYKMFFAGHCLGSGIAELLTVIVANHRDKFGGIPRNLLRCYAVAPARCMSLNLAVKYDDIICSVVLQVGDA